MRTLNQRFGKYNNHKWFMYMIWCTCLYLSESQNFHLYHYRKHFWFVVCIELFTRCITVYHLVANGFLDFVKLFVIKFHRTKHIKRKARSLRLSFRWHINGKTFQNRHIYNVYTCICFLGKTITCRMDVANLI